MSEIRPHTFILATLLIAFPLVCTIAQTPETKEPQTQLPKRVRWSKPLCEEIDMRGRQVGTIDPAIARCDEIYVQGQVIRSIEGKHLYVSSIAGYYENH